MSRHYGSTSDRGYGSPHQKLRAHWKPYVDSGQVECHAIICLEERDGRSRWILPGSPWHLGHTPDRSAWTGPEHARCGASDGATRGNQDRPRYIAAALPGRDTICQVCGKTYHYAAKQCMICGQHYHPSRQVQYTCSRPCGAAYRRLTRGYAGNAPPSPPPACQICGKPCLVPAGVSRACSATCAEQVRKQRLSERQCAQCGKTFTAQSAQWCSANCQALAYYYANREQVLGKMREKREALASRAW